MKYGILKRRAIAPSEYQIQSAYFDLVRLYMPNTKLIYAVPNGVNMRSPVTRLKYWKEGRIAGMPDVNIDISRGGYHGMRIEFKRAENIGLSDEQQTAFDQLDEAGYFCRRHWDAQLAWQETCRYLQISARARG